MTTSTPRTDAAIKFVREQFHSDDCPEDHAAYAVAYLGGELTKMERELAVAQEEAKREKMAKDYWEGAYKRDLTSAQKARQLAEADAKHAWTLYSDEKEARQRAEERAQAWREKTHEAEDVALAALASFSLTQSVDDYPEDHWSHKAERIRTIRAAIDAARSKP